MLRLDHAAIHQFRTFLEEISLAPLVRSLRPTFPFENPWPHFKSLKSRLEKLPVELQPAYHLMLLGEVVPLKEITSLLPQPVLGMLVDIGLMTFESATHLRTDGYAVVPYGGHYFIADLPPAYPTYRKLKPEAYIDTDSFFLAGLLPAKPKERLLDICTGAGMLAIVGAANTQTVVATEINPNALNVARFNAILNGVDEKITFLEGDLFTPVEPCEAELICANPPYLALPEDTEEYLAGNGGEEGITIVRSLLLGLDKYLAQDGYALVMGGTYERQDAVSVADSLRKTAEDVRMRLDIFLLERLTMQQYARATMINFENPEQVARSIETYAAARGISGFCIMLIQARRANGIGSIRLFNGLTSISQRIREARQDRRELERRRSVST